MQARQAQTLEAEAAQQSSMRAGDASRDEHGASQISPREILDETCK